MSSQGFDASSVKRSTWIAGGGAVLLLISTFLSWWKASDEIAKLASALGRGTPSVNGWDTGALGKLVFLVALIAIALVVVDYMKVEIPQMPVPISLALLGAGGLAVLLVLIRIVDMPDGANRAYGLWVALIAALVLTYGGWLKLQEDS